MSLLPACDWLATTPWSIALHESLYVYPIVETLHVLALIPFVGTLIFVDLRLLGWVFRDIPVTQVTLRVLPWTIAGFVLAVITGGLLFYAIPIRTYQSVFFRIKILLMICAALNAWYFHRRITAQQNNEPLSRSTRLAGAFSLVAWIGVTVSGRMIAYNWFDCGRQPQPDFINWAAGCVLEGL